VNPKDTMKDEEKKVTTPPASPKEDKSNNTETVDQEWAKVVDGKFTSPTEVAKAYKELETKYGEQSTEVKQAREMMTTVTPILEAIQNDPVLFKQLEEKLSADNSPKKTPANKKKASKDNSQSDVRQVASDLVLSKFEEKHGIDKMEPEERRILRQKIGDALFELTGTNLNGVDLRKLGNTLENSYIISKYKSKPADSAADDEVDRASISSIPSKDGKKEAALTPDEAETAEKMGLSREQYLEGKIR